MADSLPDSKLNKSRGLFRDAYSGRVKWGWRVLALFFVAFLILQLSFILLPSTDNPSEMQATLNLFRDNVFKLTLFILFAAFWLWRVDRRRPADYGLQLDRFWWADLGGGMLIGLFVTGGVFLTAVAFGWVSIERFRAFTPAFTGLFFFSLFVDLLVPLWEEPLFRGMMLRTAAEGLHTGRFKLSKPKAALIGLLVTVPAFMALHFGFLPSIFLYYVGASLILGIPALLTGRLGLSIGIHLMYNFGKLFLFPIELPVPGLSGFVQTTVSETAPPTIFFPNEETFLSLVPHLTLDLIFMALGILLSLLWIRWLYGKVRIFEGWSEPLNALGG